MFKRFFFSLLCCILLVGIYQQAYCQFSETSYPFNTHYYFNQYLYNPAFAGDNLQPVAALSFKETTVIPNQGISVDFHASTHLSQYLSGVGFVFSLRTDTTYRGYLSAQYRVGASYNFKYEFGEKSILKVGFTGNLLHYENNTDPTLFNTQNVNYSPLNERLLKASYDVGFLLNFPAARIAASVNHVNQPSFRFWDPYVSYRFRQELFLTASADWNIGDNLTLTPGLMLQQEERSFLTQFDLIANYQDFVFAGFAFRNGTDGDVSDTLNRRNDTHKLRLTLATRILERYQITGSVDLPSNSVYKRHFEISIGIFKPRSREIVDTETSFRSRPF